MRRVGVANVNLRPARRGARAGADRGGAGRARPVRRRARCAAAWSSGAPSSASRVMAHSPLGGPRREGRLARHDALAASRTRTARPGADRARVAARAVAGGGRDPGRAAPETARSAAARGDARARRRRACAARGARSASARPRPGRRRDAEVVLVMGIPGAGKSRLAEELRRTRLRTSEPRRARRLAARARDGARRVAGRGARRVVLDNTYLTRASRSYAVDAAGRHGSRRAASGSTRRSRRRRSISSSGCWSGSARCRRPRSCSVLARGAGHAPPTSQMRALRELEPPAADEGFGSVEQRDVRARPWRPRARRRLRRRGGTGAAGWQDAVAQADRLRRISSSTGAPEEMRATSHRSSRRWLPRCPAPVAVRSARIRAGRRRAGAGRRFPDSCSRSPASTRSIPRGRSSSARAPRTGRLRRRLPRATWACVPRGRGERPRRADAVRLIQPLRDDFRPGTRSTPVT